MKFLGKANKLGCINLFIISAGISYSGKKWGGSL